MESSTLNKLLFLTKLAPNEKMKSEVQYCQHLVCIMDLLGQKAMYAELESYPLQPDGIDPEFQKKLIQFIRSIEYFKKDVDTFFNAANSYTSNYKWPDTAKKFRHKVNNNICKIQRFSDGIVIYVPLAETDSSFPICSVRNALLCTASTMLSSLAKGVPIRVGIGIGGAVEIEDGELFGPAIGYAHDMETKKAINPRIAIHKNVLEYLESYATPQTNSINTPDHQLAHKMAKLCRKMITADIDGEYILDYLGNEVWNNAFQGGDKKLLEMSFAFIQKEKLRFQTEGNEKLFSKYLYLYKYFTDSQREELKPL